MFRGSDYSGVVTPTGLEPFEKGDPAGKAA